MSHLNNECIRRTVSSELSVKYNTKGVLKLLKDIKPHKATGPDNIPGRLLKEAAEELAPGLLTME